MPAQPTLHKSKSNLRLKLGFAPARPKPTSSAREPAPPLPVAPSPPRSSTLAIAALTSSTSSTGTGTSRPDSRSLFAYDSTSPSSLGHANSNGNANGITTTGLTFDTISYASNSPSSLAFNHAILPSPRHGVYPTPSTSGYDTRDDTDADADGETDLEFLDQGDGLDRPSLEAYPNIRNTIKASDDVFFVSDAQLSDRFHFVAEVGFGNWGSVWLAKPRRPRSTYFSNGVMTPSQKAVRKLGKAAAASGGSGAGGKVAMKIVHRVQDSCTAARIRALWGEMKIVRSLRHEPHPSIIQFEAFCLTPSYAVVIMPYLSHLIQVCLPPKRATPYFRQLASAVGYLHERGITHNDIKPANVMISHNDIPVLVDFGFAHKWPTDGRGAFLSTISWGTPEYLDPYRAQGLPHDERASDVWSLAITFYEILIGRTPFEENEEEDFQEEGRYAVYLERALSGEWLGEYYIPNDLIHLLQNMLHPDAQQRLTAMNAYHHPALHPAAPSVIVTPHFIREATFDVDAYAEQPVPTLAPVGVALDGYGGYANGSTDPNVEKRRKKKKVAPKEGARSVTPALPLGESIKQHTSMPRPKKQGQGQGQDGEGLTPSPKKGSRLVIKKMRSEEVVGGDVKDKEDPTPTKIVKPAQPLKMVETTAVKADKKLISRPSQAQLRAVANANAKAAKHDSGLTSKTGGTNSTRSSLLTTTTSKENLHPSKSTKTKTLSQRTSNLSTLSTVSTVQGEKNEDEARLHTLQSLEGVRSVSGAGAGGKKRDVLAAISRPAPEPPRPRSAGTIETGEGKKEKEAQRRSWAAERAMALEEVEEMEEQQQPAEVMDLEVRVSTSSDSDKTTIDARVDVAFHTAPRSTQSPMAHVGSPPRKRLAKPAVPDSAASGEHADERAPPPRLAFVSPGKKSAGSPNRVEKEKMMTQDEDKLGRFRQISADLTPAQFTPSSARASAVAPAATNTAPAIASTATTEPSLQHRKSIEALALDNRLDKISEWVKTVESIVDEARKALAEGRELPLPLLTIPTPADMAGIPGLPSMPSTITGTAQDTNLPTPRSATATNPALTSEERNRMFGVSPPKAIPEHLRTSSVQVEPATPPKWMTYAEAEEKIRKANVWMGEGKGGSRPSSGVAMGMADKRVSGMGKKERGSVASVLKLFGAEKEKEKERGVRSSTPEPNMHIPLKPPAPALRATPSTPMLRSDSSAAAATTRIPARKSESNLRAFNTLPASSHITFSDILQQSAFSDDEDDDDEDYGRGQARSTAGGRPGSPRSPRRLYERFLDSTPGVVRQGDGWSSLSSGRALAKPSSMASLRERARALLHGDTFTPNPTSIGGVTGTTGTTGNKRDIIDLANQERRNSKQPLVHSSTQGDKFGTANSAAMSTFSAGAGAGAGGGGMGRPNMPGAGSVLTIGTSTSMGGGGGQKGWGIWKGLKGLGKKGRGMDKVEEIHA